MILVFKIFTFYIVVYQTQTLSVWFFSNTFNSKNFKYFVFGFSMVDW